MGRNALQKEGRYTYADYIEWPDNGERWEIIDGIAYMLTAPNDRHQQIVAQLTAEFVMYLRGRQCQAFTAPYDVVLPGKNETEMTASNVVQPDLLVICDRSKRDGKKCIGAPDLVIEVISPSTVKRDILHKYRLYERSGVREFWLVQPSDSIIQQYLNAEGEFKYVGAFARDDEISPAIFPEMVINLNNVFGPEE